MYVNTAPVFDFMKVLFIRRFKLKKIERERQDCTRFNNKYIMETPVLKPLIIYQGSLQYL